MTQNDNGNGHRRGLLSDLLDALLYLGRGLFARKNPHDPQTDDVFDSEDMGVDFESSEENNCNGNGSRS
ncbi:MAG: hypothetical protein KME64_07685 [Scytonematopsis contorta HA4267-MV1]|jgi:hypothetical protein|nr:hypothetical protein [Scytonematopsis contorta HA4267-MV1]